MTQDKTRAAFEGWFSEVPLLRSGDGYKFMSAQHAWNVWQASRATVISQLDSDEMVEVVAIGIEQAALNRANLGMVTTGSRPVTKEFAKYALAAIKQKLGG